MNSFEPNIQNTAPTRASTLDNLSQLGLPENHPVLNLLWMYPSTLSLHGGRGDIMALFRFATMAGLPMRIQRVEHLNDPVPLSQGDMMYFCTGDLSCMPHVIEALDPIRQELADFAAAGKVIVANGSAGVILADDYAKQDGTCIPCLGLLHMHWTQRTTVHGDDLWFRTDDGMEIIGNEIKLADIALAPSQSPFGQVIYGKGNCGDGLEGAATGNTIYTGALGPVLVRNPAFALNLLQRAVDAAPHLGIKAPLTLPAEKIALEQKGIDEAKAFIQKKMK